LNIKIHVAMDTQFGAGGVAVSLGSSARDRVRGTDLPLDRYIVFLLGNDP